MDIEKAKAKARAIIIDPAKLEEIVNKAWAKLDPENKGYTTYDAVKTAVEEQIKKFGLLKESQLLNKKKLLKN